MKRYYGVFERIKDKCPELINEYPLYYKEAADLYDHLSEENSDVDYFMQQALIYGGPMLELCCGSGRLTLPLLKSGLKITAVDLSEDMLLNMKLQLDNRKYSRIKKNLTIVKGDMTKLNLKEKYNLIIIGATSIRLVEKDFKDFFDSMYELLNEGGCLFFDFENVPVKNDQQEIVEPMIIVDYMNNDNNLSLVCMQRVFKYKEKRAFVNAMRIIPKSDEKLMLSYTDYRLFGIDDIKNAADNSKFGSCEIIQVPGVNNYFCKMIKK